MFMSSEVFERVEKVFRTVLTPPQMESFNLEATMDDVDGWDSLSFLSIIMGLEGEFSVRIDGLDAISLTSVANIITFLQSKS
jgi:acyl carrier protein